MNSRRVGVQAASGIEPAGEPARELVVVGGEAPPGVVGRGIRGLDLHEAGVEEPHHRAHRLDQAAALPIAERLEHGCRERIAAAVELGALGPPGPVGCTVRTRESPADGTTVTSPSRSSERSSRLR